MNQRKNILIGACGNKSYLVEQSWLKEAEIRNFDTCILFFHEQVEKPERHQGIDYFFHLKGFKYPMLHELLTKLRPDFLEQYDHFFLMDDDIKIDTKDINRMFDLCRAFDPWIAQPSLSENSYLSWTLLRNRKDCFARYVGEIEVMAPLFNRYALKKCLPTFSFNKRPSGLDAVWPKLLGYPKNRLMVFDEIQMVHTRPVGGGELLKNSGVDQKTAWEATVKHYSAKKENFVEYSRLMRVSANHHQLQHAGVKLNERLQKFRRQIHDLGIPWRIRNRLGIKQPVQKEIRFDQE